MQSNKVYIDDSERLYHYKEKIAKERQAVETHPGISATNKKIILDFVNYRQIQKNNSNGRIIKLLNKLKIIAILLQKDFDTAEKKDILLLLEKINQRPDLSIATKVDYRIIIKLFYKWLLGEDKKYPLLVEDIQSGREKKHRLPEEILTEEDVLKIIHAAENPRDKAIAALLADSGCRLSELLNAHLRSLIFNDEEQTIRFIIENGKTGGRSLILIPSVTYLISYINTLPETIKSNKDNFLFVLMKKGEYLQEQMTQPALSQLLYKLGKRAGIQKKTNPHAWRRFSATNSASFMSSTALMMRYGWSQRSTIDSYAFMNPTESDNIYKARYGKASVEPKESKLLPIKCSCGTLNPADALCSNCGKPNTLKIAIKREEGQQEGLKKIKQALELIGGNLNEETRLQLRRILG